MPLTKRQQFVPGLLLACVVLAVYGRTLGNGFVWDDRIFVVGNRLYQQFALQEIFFSLANRVEYLPLRDLTYAVDYLFWGWRPAGFHLTNLLLFTANVLLVKGVARRLLSLIDRQWEEPQRGEQAALVTALFFAVQPLNSEAVNFIICRNVLVSGLCFFGACLAYLRFLTEAEASRYRWYALALVAFLGGLLAKATAIVLPLVLLLVTCYGPAERRRQGWLLLSPFFLLAGSFYPLYVRIAVKTAVIDDQFSTFAGSVLAARLAKALQIPFFYLGKLLLPVGFSAEYDVNLAETLTAPAVLLAMVGLLLLTGVALLLRRRFPELLAGLAWYLAASLPILNLFATNPAVADRYVFLPLFGLTLLLAAGLVRLTADRPKALIACCLLLSCLWGGLALRRSGDWQSDRALWEANIRTAPKQSKSYVNLANDYYGTGAFDQALAVLAKGRASVPLDAYYAYFEGLLAEKRGDLAAATAALKKATEYKDGYIEALYRLGTIAEAQGDDVRAAEYYARVLQARSIDVNHLVPQAREKRQELYRKLAPRFASLQERVAAVPGDLQARGQLALQLDQMGFYEEALVQYQEMEKRGFDQWPLFYNMGNSYLNLQRPREAAAYFARCLAVKPGYGDALNGLGIARKTLGDYTAAVAAFAEAVQRDPGNGSARFNLAKTYYQMGDRANALRQFQLVLNQFPALAERVAPYRQLLADQ
jgi:protein O-mannosyl-transferase